MPINAVTIATSKPTTTITTTINLGSITRPQGREGCVITPTTPLQSVVSKVTQLTGTVQPRVITLPSSSSMSATTVNATTVPILANQNQPNTRPSAPSILPSKTTPTNTLTKPVQTTIRPISNPHSIGPVKVLAAPTGSVMQPVQMTVSAAVASTGQTGHTVILKKAGKIETFPVPPSNSTTNAPISISQTSRESVSQIPGIPGCGMETSRNNSKEPLKVVIPKLTYSGVEGVKNNTHLQPSIIDGSKQKFSNGAIVRPTIGKSVTEFQNSEHNSGSISTNKMQSSSEYLAHATPDSTASSFKANSVNSVRSGATNCINSIQPNSAHNNITTEATTHLTGFNDIATGGLGDRKNMEVKPDYMGACVRKEQDSSLNSSFRDIKHKGFESQLENSASSESTLKRTLSSTTSVGGQYINSGGDQIRSDNTINTLTHQQGNSEAKKPKL